MSALLDRVPTPLRRFARLALSVAVLALVHEALAWWLVEIGLVARLLSPAPDAAFLGAALLALAFYALRLGLVLVAPPALAAELVRGIAALLASGEEPPPLPERPGVRPPRGPERK